MDRDLDQSVDPAASGDPALLDIRSAPGQSVLRPMVLGLIQSSYVRTQTFGEFARDVFDILATAASVPVAFAEGFLRSFLSIESVEEDAFGRVTIRPKPGASEEDIVREVDEIAARIDPGAVYNPVVRRQMDRVAEASHRVMQQDLQALADLSPGELQSALQDLEEAEMPRPPEASPLDATEQLRQRLARVRHAVRAYQAGMEALPPDEQTGG